MAGPIAIDGDLTVLWSALVASAPVSVHTATTTHTRLVITGWDHNILHAIRHNTPTTIELTDITAITIHPRS